MRKILMVAAILVLSAPALAAQTWTVDVIPAVDSTVRATMDTAHAEPAFCVGADVDEAAHRITVWQALPAQVIGRQTRDMVQFACPAGAALAHGHFLTHDEVDGPSDVDLAALRALPARERPPVALIVVADVRGDVHYVPYGVR